jgi:hypothetical protein
LLDAVACSPFNAQQDVTINFSMEEQGRDILSGEPASDFSRREHNEKVDLHRLKVVDSLRLSGSNSAVECQLPKLDVAGSIPVSRF